MPSRPNILWICNEHVRHDTVAALGNGHIRTPALDRLVGEGQAFTHTYAQSPLCTPSRVSFLTGRYPAATGIRQNGQDIGDDEVLITRVLADEGYDCGLFGKLHVRAAFSGSESRTNDGYRRYQWSHAPFPRFGGAWAQWLERQGVRFDDLLDDRRALNARFFKDRRYHQTTWCMDQAIDFIQEGLRPWLVSINPFAAHDPFDCLSEYFDRYDPHSLPCPEIHETEASTNVDLIRAAREFPCYTAAVFGQTTRLERQQMVAAYYATIEHFDAELARVLDLLDRTGQRDNTLIIYHGDHGEPLGDHGILTKGGFFYEGCIRVPLILSWPGRFAAGARHDALVELVDLVPTIRELLGLDDAGQPPAIQGRSLVGLIDGRSADADHRRGVLAEHYNAGAAKHSPDRRRNYATMYRERRHKVVVRHGTSAGELYDLEDDPRELRNLWDDPACAAIREEMVRRCFDAKVFTTDPLPTRTASF